MTISAVVPDIAFAGSSGSGTMGPFSLIKNGTPLVFFANSEVVVLRYDSVTDTTPTLLVEGTHYTLTGGPTAGSITLISPSTGLLTAERLYVTTVSALAQSLDLVNGGNFSSSNLERRLDVIFQILQQHAREIKSTIRFAMFDTDEIPKITPLGAVLDKIPYVSGTAANPVVAYLDALVLNDLSELGEDALADIAVVAADLASADTIGLVAAAIDDVEDVAAALDDVATVAGAIVDGTVGGKLNYAALTAIPAVDRSDNMVVYVASRTTDGDGGEGWWRFDAASSATTNGGTILAPDAGTGRWLRQYSGEINGKWFGATGDGSTNDRDAIQNTLTAAASAATTAYFPAGTYRMNSGVSVASSDVLIRGDGSDATVFVAYSATADLFTFGDGTNIYTGVYMRDVGFTAAGAGNPRTAGAYVKFNKITQGGIRNFRSNVCFKTVEFLDCVLVEADDGYITNPTATTGVGIRVRGGNDQTISNVLVAGNASAECRAGVQIETTAALWMDNVGALDTGIGLLLQPTTGGDVIEHLFMSRCAWDNCSSHGVLIDAAAGTTIRRVKSFQDWTATNDGNGVVTNGAGTIQDIEFVGLRSYNNTLRGFLCGSGTDVRLIGGTYSGNSRGSSGTYDGILFDNIDGFSVIGVRSGAVAGFSNTQRYGIVVNNAASDNYTITDCDTRTNVTGQISVPAYGVTKKVFGNLGFVSEKRATATGQTTDGSGDITITHGLSGTPARIFVQPAGVGAVYIWGVHTVGATTFKIRFFNGGAGGAALTSFALGDVYWDASL